MVMESLVLVFLVNVMFVILFYKKSSSFNMISSYECGFDPKCDTRLVFSYRFFLISILFIIFDVEISLMISFPFFLYYKIGNIIFYLFIFILIIGLLYEYYYGSLNWLYYKM